MPTPLLEDRPLTALEEFQALLFRDDEIEALVVKAEKQGRYTAARLRAKQPTTYDAVVGLLAKGIGMIAIGQLFGLHHKTVAAVRDDNPEPIDIERSKRVTRLLTAADLQVERLIESPESAPMNVAGLIASQLYEKAELLAGRATQRTEVTECVDIQDQYKKLLASVKEKQLSGDQVREMPVGTGLVGEKTLPLEAPAEGPAAPESDTESDVSSHSPEESVDGVTRNVTESDPESETEARSEEAAPGGGSTAGPEADPSSRSGSAKFSDNCSQDPSTPAL